MKKIVILKTGNSIVVDTNRREIVTELLDEVTFEIKEFNHPATVKAELRKVRRKLYDLPADASMARRYELDSQVAALQTLLKRPMQIISETQGVLDHRGRFATAWGFYDRIVKKLKQLGFNEIELKDLRPHPNPDVFKPQWERLYQTDIVLAKSQEEFLVKFFAHNQGRFDLPTAFGKTFMIGVIAILCPQARIHVVTKRAAVLKQRIYPELCQLVPSVGIVMSTKKKWNQRVMCYSAGSLHRSDFKADYLIADECHELAADSYSEKLGNYLYTRNYGLSASQDMRLDEKDFRNEAAFGPIIMKREYLESVEEGQVVPITIKWKNVIMDMNPAEEAGDLTERKRYGIWQNEYRNGLIAEDARSYGADTQVLITVETIDHAIYLKQMLPEFKLAYSVNGLSAKKRKRYVAKRLLKVDEPYMTEDRLAKLARAFERHRLKKVICTSVWNVGVDFRDLRILIRADAGGSKIGSVQLPGRTSRLGRFTNKADAVVHDYMDQFDVSFRRKAEERHRSYEELKFKQELPKTRNIAR